MASYADTDTVSNLANEIMANDDRTDDAVSKLITRAIKHADNKINGKLRKSQIPIPKIPTDKKSVDEEDPLQNLFEAGDLYASAFVMNTKYAESDNISPAVKTYRDDADEAVDTYIEIILEGYNEADPDNPVDVKMPVGSLVRRCW